MGATPHDDDPEAAAARLADAPIVLIGSRRTIGWVAVFSPVRACGFWEMARSGTWYGVPVPAVGGAALVLGLTGAAAATVQLFRPPSLTFTTENLTVRTFLTSSELRWSDIERFHVWRPPSASAGLRGSTHAILLRFPVESSKLSWSATRGAGRRGPGRRA